MKHLLFFLFIFPFMYLRAQEMPYTFINLAGEACTETDYSYPVVDDVIIFCKNGSYGMKDKEGNILQFDEKYIFGKPIGHGVSFFADKNGKNYLFDRKGKPLACGDINYAREPQNAHGHDIVIKKRVSFHNQRLVVGKDGKWGVIDTTGQWIVSPEYENIQDFDDPVYYIEKNGKKGLLDKITKKEILTDYTQIAAFSDGLSAVKKDDKIGYINYAGELIVPLKKASFGGYFIDGVAYTEKEGKGIWIDKSGKEVKDISRNSGYEMTATVWYDVILNANFIYSRTAGKYLINGTYLSFKSNYNDWAWFKKDNSKDVGVLMNYSAKTIIPDTVIHDSLYENYSLFQFPIALEKGTGSIGIWAYFDTNGRRVSLTTYLAAGNFDHRGLARVIRNTESDALKKAQEKSKEDLKNAVRESQAREKAEQEAKEALEKAKIDQENANKPCEKCGGIGYMVDENKKRCSSCSGSGGSRCTSCGGAGRVYFTAPSGKQESRYCTACGGDGKKECYSCGGKGYIIDKDTPVCPHCNGTGRRGGK